MNTKMKFVSFLFILTGLLFVTMSCEDDDKDEKNDEIERNLDENLIGYWQEESSGTAWEFKSNGEMTQIILGVEYEWEWESKDAETIELWNRGTKKEHAAVTEKIYKIEDGKLYFYAESAGVWSLPFIKE